MTTAWETRMDDREFASAVLLMVADRLGVRQVREWENAIGGAEYADAQVRLLRHGAPDPDDARWVALRITDNVSIFHDGE